MKTRECDICGENITSEDKGSVSFGVYDLCGNCVAQVRQATCLRCHGTGKFQTYDKEASIAQASCGESRSQYKTVNCDRC